MSNPSYIVTLVAQSTETAQWVSTVLKPHAQHFELHVLSDVDRLRTYLDEVEASCLVVEGTQNGPDELVTLDQIQHCFGASAKHVPPVILIADDASNALRLRALKAGALDVIDRTASAQQSLPYLLYNAVEAAGLNSRIRRHEAEFQDYLAGSSEGVCVFVDGQIAYRNVAFTAMFRSAGMSPAAFVELGDVFHTQAGNFVDDLFSQMAKQTNLQPFDIPLCHRTPFDPNAPSDPIIVSVRMRRADFQGQNAWFASFIDVSKERRNESMWANLQVAYETLKVSQAHLVEAQKLQALGEMAAGVAHDFNNILSAILGRVTLIKRMVQPPDQATNGQAFQAGPEMMRSLNIIEQAAVDATETVRRIKSFSPASDEHGNSRHVDLSLILQDALEFTRTRWSPLEGPQRFSIATQLQDKNLVWGNPAELREVVVNLIGNALDSMPDGGALELGTRRDADGIIAYVKDSGQGMSEEVKSKALEPFFTTKGKSGTGLGLSVSYAILRRHQGMLEIDSQSGHGTTIYLRFPQS